MDDGCKHERSMLKLVKSITDVAASGKGRGGPGSTPALQYCSAIASDVSQANAKARKFAHVTVPCDLPSASVPRSYRYALSS